MNTTFTNIMVSADMAERMALLHTPDEISTSMTDAHITYFSHTILNMTEYNGDDMEQLINSMEQRVRGERMDCVQLVIQTGSTYYYNVRWTEKRDGVETENSTLFEWKAGHPVSIETMVHNWFIEEGLGLPATFAYGVYTIGEHDLNMTADAIHIGQIPFIYYYTQKVWGWG